jgi:hypothetical protein
MVKIEEASTMKSIRLAGLLLLLLSLVVGCRSSSGTEEAGVDIRGTVTEIVQGREDVAGSILIEGIVEEDTEYDRAFVTVTDETRIFEQVGEDRRPASFAALEIGQRVQARFTGPVMESYPVQATAAEIVILTGPEPGSDESPLLEPWQSPVSPLPRPPIGPVDAAMAHLAAELGIPSEEITFVSLTAAEWPDASLGCPEEGVMYAQVVTPGCLILLEVEGQEYELHTDETGQSVVLCE